MNSSSRSGSRSIIVIHCLAPPVARSAIVAGALTASAISRACSSISRSISTRNRSSLPSKFEYRAPVENPAAEAISSTEAPWKPLRANTPRAASSRRSRVLARLCSRVSRRGPPHRLSSELTVCSLPTILLRQSDRYSDNVHYRTPRRQGGVQLASATTSPQTRLAECEPARRRDLLRGPLRALGARQLDGHGARLHRGRPPVAGGLHRVRAHRRRCGTTACSSGARTPSPTTSRPTSTPPPRGAEVLPHHPAGRRGPPRGLLQALHARGLRDRGRLLPAAWRRSSRS